MESRFQEALQQKHEKKIRVVWRRFEKKAHRSECLETAMLYAFMQSRFKVPPIYTYQGAVLIIRCIQRNERRA
jgi:hypothetical protein